MNMKGLALSMGLGAAAGAVAIMMVPQRSSARRIATKAANKVESAACKVADTVSNKLDQMDM